MLKAGGMIRALNRLDRRGLRLTPRLLALALIACLLLGAVIIADGVMVARREALEHKSFSEHWSILDRPSHRPSALALLGVLAGVVVLRGLLVSGRSFSVPSARLTWGAPHLAFFEFVELRICSRAPPAWSRL